MTARTTQHLHDGSRPAAMLTQRKALMQEPRPRRKMTMLGLQAQMRWRAHVARPSARQWRLQPLQMAAPGLSAWQTARRETAQNPPLQPRWHREVVAKQALESLAWLKRESHQRSGLLV